eukprot:364643-Chlamydomonas_euryale.AAC.10
MPAGGRWHAWTHAPEEFMQVSVNANRQVHLACTVRHARRDDTKLKEVQQTPALLAAVGSGLTFREMTPMHSPSSPITGSPVTLSSFGRIAVSVSFGLATSTPSPRIRLTTLPCGHCQATRPQDGRIKIS